MKHKNKNIASTVLWVNKVFKGKVTFCGSFGLAINGLLDREVGDIDVITDLDYYEIDPIKWLPDFDWDVNNDLYKGNSTKFHVKGVLVKCFKLISPYGIKVDVMYRPDGTESTRKLYLGKKLKIEKPLQCINVKLEYLIRWQEMEGCTGQSDNKHRSDIDYYKKCLGMEYDYEINRITKPSKF